MHKVIERFVFIPQASKSLKMFGFVNLMAQISCLLSFSQSCGAKIKYQHYNLYVLASSVLYRIVGKFGRGKFSEFGKSSVILQTKAIQISIYN